MIISSKDVEDMLAWRDRESPIVPLAVIGAVWCPTPQHAALLKQVLDEILLGRRPEENRLRHAWRHLGDPDVAWPIILNDALDQLRQRRIDLDVFDDEERARRIEREQEK